MTYWIRAYNDKRYRVDDFIHDNGFIEWEARQRFEVGDVVFLYATAPQSCIRWMMEVSAVGLHEEELAQDESYYISQVDYDSRLRDSRGRTYVRMDLVKELRFQGLTLASLREHGMSGAPRSPRRLGWETVDYVMSRL